MIKDDSIYLWDNVDNKIHKIQSLIEFKYYTIYLYDIKYSSK